jgi:hypothetical protein
VRIGHEVLPK